MHCYWSRFSVHPFGLPQLLRLSLFLEEYRLVFQNVPQSGLVRRLLMFSFRRCVISQDYHRGDAVSSVHCFERYVVWICPIIGTTVNSD